MSRCRVVRSRVEMFVGMWGLLVMPRSRCLYVCHRLCRTSLYPASEGAKCYVRGATVTRGKPRVRELVVVFSGGVSVSPESPEQYLPKFHYLKMEITPSKYQILYGKIGTRFQMPTFSRYIAKNIKII